MLYYFDVCVRVVLPRNGNLPQPLMNLPSMFGSSHVVVVDVMSSTIPRSLPPLACVALLCFASPYLLPLLEQDGFPIYGHLGPEGTSMMVSIRRVNNSSNNNKV